MIQNLTWIETENTWPYRNLAMEEYMTLHAKQGECVLFLWQNRRTVVIGKNQNCWKECRVSALEEDGGFLARRLSGGGAVFHDLGNLNFTFIARRADYNVDRQLQVIIEALKTLGIHSEKTGRNDVTVEGRKFSGNAFYQSGDYCCHHGTLLVDVDSALMSRYLNVSREKLAAKGVSSVKSRVVNLRELLPELTIAQLKEALVNAFSQVYGLTPRRMDETELPAGEIDRLAGRFASDQWKYGRKMSFDYEFSRRFDWGDIQLQLHVDRGIVLEAAAYSDAMDPELIGRLPEVLKGCVCGREALCEAVDQLRDNGTAAQPRNGGGGDSDGEFGGGLGASGGSTDSVTTGFGTASGTTGGGGAPGSGACGGGAGSGDLGTGELGADSGPGGSGAAPAAGGPEYPLSSRMLSDIKALISESF